MNGLISLRKVVDYNSSLDDFEFYLSETLTPINPNPVFVYELKQRLVGSKIKNNNRTKILRYSVFGTAGVISSLILIVTSIRTVITVMGTIRMLRRADATIN